MMNIIKTFLKKFKKTEHLQKNYLIKIKKQIKLL